MKIHRPHSVAGFEWVQTVDDGADRQRLVHLGDEPVLDAWVPPRVRRLEEDEGGALAPADLPWFGGHWLVMRERARSVLAPVLGSSVELLPLDCDDGTPLWITHCLVSAAVLDLERSDIKRLTSGGIMRIGTHVFLPGVADAGPAFHLEAMHRGALYVTDEVVDAVAGAGLTGVRFETVWSDESLES